MAKFSFLCAFLPSELTASSLAYRDDFKATPTMDDPTAEGQHLSRSMKRDRN